jgi:dihydrodipicolinate synthase/N-acetylneuraminate lyase
VFTGTGTAIITPFNDDYSVEYDSLRLIVKDQIYGGVAALPSTQYTHGYVTCVLNRGWC